MLKKKLFITDLDGTFVKDSKVVDEEDKVSLKELKKTMLVGIATGRSVKEIDYIEEQTQIDFDVHIGFNGAIIEVNGERIFEKKIQMNTLDRVLKFIEENNLVFDALNGEDRIGTHKINNKARLWNMEIVEPDNLFDILRKETIYKINIRPDKNRCDELIQELQEKFSDLTICKSGDERVELTSKNITKGHAVQILKEKYGDINIISVGDSENDISMFKESDQSFCITHASEEVKEHASEVVESFHEAANKINEVYLF